MDAKLRYVEIKKLFGQYDVEWNIEKDTTVLVGQNGSGKTTILKVLMTALSNEHKVVDSLANDIIGALSKVDLYLSDERHIRAIYNRENFDSYLDYFLNSNRDDKESMFKSLSEFSKMPINSLSVSQKFMKCDSNDDAAKQEYAIELISTLNLSANALNNVPVGDGTDLNVLDVQIERAIIAFQKLRELENYSEIKDKVIQVLNDFFSTTQKTIELSDTDFVIKNLKKEVLKLSQLSAGERQIIYIVFKVATAYFNEALILMDEPEISLHLEWQEKLLKNLREINDKSQMIVVTHSPAIIMDGWMDSYVDIQTILKPVKDDE